MKFSEKLKTLRKARNFSQEYVAEHCHVSRQAVSRWESEDAFPDIDNLIIISELFKVSVDYLVKEAMANDFWESHVKVETTLSYKQWMHQWCIITLEGYNSWFDMNETLAILDEDDEFLYLQLFKKKNPERFGILRKNSVASIEVLKPKKFGSYPNFANLDPLIKSNPFAYFIHKECDIFLRCDGLKDTLLEEKAYLKAYIDTLEQAHYYVTHGNKQFTTPIEDIIRIVES